MAKSEDPKYVRLTPRLTRGIVCDVESSGWSISGLDVKPFPEGDSPRDKAAQKFVRAQLNAGKLEPCSKAEWEEVQEQNASIPKIEGMHQEGQVRRASEAASEAIRKSREEAVASGANGPSGEPEGDEGEGDDESEEEPKKAAPKSKSKSKSKS